MVMALPLLIQIRKKHPDAKITWLCGKVVFDLLSHFKEIDELIAVDETMLLSKGIIGKLSAIFEIWKKLIFRKFDLGLYFYFTDMYRILFFPAQIGTIKRFEKTKGKRQNPIPGRHHSFDYISTFEETEGPYTYRIEYPKFRYENNEVAKLKENHNGKKWIVLSCGGAKNILRDDDLRRWPIENYAALGKQINEAGFQLVLTGAPSDKWVESHFETIPHISFIGKLRLKDFIAFLKISDVLITHDSGPLHLADLAGCPVIGLFGPTIPQEKISLQEKSTFIWGGEKLSCRPCYDGRSYAICSRPVCIESISVDQVFNLIKERV